MSIEQGCLFGTDQCPNGSLPTKKPYGLPTGEKKDIVRPLPRKPLKYSDYLRIHCGNSAAANYWYNKYVSHLPS